MTPIHSTELSDLWFMKFDEALMKHQSDIQVKTYLVYFTPFSFLCLSHRKSLGPNMIVNENNDLSVWIVKQMIREWSGET